MARPSRRPARRGQSLPPAAGHIMMAPAKCPRSRDGLPAPGPSTARGRGCSAWAAPAPGPPSVGHPATSMRLSFQLQVVRSCLQVGETPDGGPGLGPAPGRGRTIALMGN